MGILGNCLKCGVELKIGYRSKPIGEQSEFNLCYECAKVAGTLPNQDTVDLCNIIAGNPPAAGQGEGPAPHRATAAD